MVKRGRWAMVSVGRVKEGERQGMVFVDVRLLHRTLAINISTRSRPRLKAWIMRYPWASLFPKSPTDLRPF